MYDHSTKPIIGVLSADEFKESIEKNDDKNLE